MRQRAGRLARQFHFRTVQQPTHPPFCLPQLRPFPVRRADVMLLPSGRGFCVSLVPITFLYCIPRAMRGLCPVSHVRSKPVTYIHCSVASQLPRELMALSLYAKERCAFRDKRVSCDLLWLPGYTRLHTDLSSMRSSFRTARAPYCAMEHRGRYLECTQHASSRIPVIINLAMS